jgi:hypothetical protein
MDKKKVSKSSSKSKPIPKKIVKNTDKVAVKETIAKEDVKTNQRRKVLGLMVKKAHKAAGQKKAEDIQKIAEQKSAEQQKQPIIEQQAPILKSSKPEETTAESSIITKKIGIPSIFVEETDENAKAYLRESEKKERIENIFRTIVMILFGIAVLFSMLILVLSIDVSEEKTTTMTTNITQYITMNISFDKYMNIPNRSYIEQVSLLGYLHEESTNEGLLKIYNKYIVDDNNNRIRLSLGYNEEQQFGKYFILNQTTNYTFNITGKFQYGYDSYIISVKNITSQKKQLIRQDTINTSNVSTKDINIKINISKGIGKII